MYSRRLFMGGAAATLGLAACAQAPVSAPVATGNRKLNEIGLQTYTLRNIFEDDPVGTLRMIKDVGYDYVELNGRNFSERSTEDLTAMVRDAGLYAPITHYGHDTVRDDFAQTVRDAQSLGVDYMVIPYISEEHRNVEGYRRIAKLLNERGRDAIGEGFKLAYHNHQFEFFDLGGGQSGMDILLNETDPDIVDFELDLFWTRLEVEDIPAFLRAHPGRFKMAHVKDMKGDPKPWRGSVDFDAIKPALMVNVGEGDMPFEEYFALNDVSGMKYFILEHDEPAQPYRQAVATSHNNARALRF